VTHPVAPTACAGPHPPTAALDWSTTGLSRGRGESVEIVGPTTFDTDGDRVPDTITTTSDGTTIARARDALTLPAGATVANAVDPFDVDGDDLTDPLVALGGQLYVIPGRTPSGAVDPAAVGVGLPDPSATWIGVGDTDGDGGDDLAVDLGGTTQVHSGAAISAAGPGGTYRAAPTTTGPGSPVTGLRFSDGAAVATLEPAGSDAALLHLLLTPEITLTTAGSGIPFTALPGHPTSTVHLYADTEGAWVTLEQDEPTRNRIWEWELAALCAAPPILPPATTDPPVVRPVEPSAGPAVAIPAAALFTG
jgi:hypothetical protein